MANISLRKIDQDNLVAILKLKVKPEQDGFVASNAASLAQASFHNEAWCRAIYADAEPVGFVMLSIKPDEPEYFLWRFMVDAAQQGRGYGRAAIKQVIKYLQGETAATELGLSYKKGDHSPEGFYLKCGFTPTDEIEDGEHIMKMDLPSHSNDRLVLPAFPRSAKYNPDWFLEGPFGGNAVWLAEWLTDSDALQLQPGMRVLDLGCGRAKSSIFLAKEFGVQVWATDLWINASENQQRIAAADLSDQVFPIHADARSLPFAAEFFDAILCVDAYPYIGTDDLYLNYLVQFVKPDGPIAIAGAGTMKEFDGPVPDHLKQFWVQDCWALHTADWWRHHWERTGIVDVQVADTMPDGIDVWKQWNDAIAANPVQWFVDTLEQDAGEYLGYIRMIATRNSDAELADYCWPDQLKSWPIEFKQHPLLRPER